MKRLLNFVSGLLIIFSLTACNTQIEGTTTQIPTMEPALTVTAEPIVQPVSELTVHFVDVGQADAAIL